VSAPQEKGSSEGTVVETTETSMSGGQHKSMRGKALCFIYGHGATDVDIAALIAHQKTHDILDTMRVGRSSMSMRRLGDPRKINGAIAAGSTAASSCWSSR